MAALCNNCRMPENQAVQAVDYYEVSDALDRASSPLEAADAHGLLTGLICATGSADQRSWLPQAFEGYDPANRGQSAARRLLERLAGETMAGLNSPDLDFELLLPDSGDPLGERTEALGAWCSGFLSGMGMGNLPPQEQLSEDVRELLDDLSQISRVDFEVEQPDEEDLAAFEEVLEYVRVGALLIYEELQPSKAAPRSIQ